MGIKEYAILDDYVNYTGPLEIQEFYALLDHFFRNNHYDKNEKKHYEKRTEDERYIEMLLEPFKTVANEVKLKIYLEIYMRNIKDIEYKVKGKKRTVQQADMSIRFRAFVIKTYPSVWEIRPFLFFIRVFIDRMIYNTHFSHFSKEVANDTLNLKNNIKNFLNLYQRK